MSFPQGRRCRNPTYTVAVLWAAGVFSRTVFGNHACAQKGCRQCPERTTPPQLGVLVVPFFRLYFKVCLLNLNGRKKGPLIIKGLITGKSSQAPVGTTQVLLTSTNACADRAFYRQVGLYMRILGGVADSNSGTWSRTMW